MSIFKHRETFSYASRDFLPIIRDGAVATMQIAGGRMMPALRLDGTGRPDIADMIEYHICHKDGGDVTTKWGLLKDPKGYVALLLGFVRPYQTTAAIPFSIRKHQILVEGILQAGCVCIEVGEPDDTSPMMVDISRPRLVVHVPDTGFTKIWPKLRDAQLYKFYRSQGLSRRTARAAVSKRVESSQQILALNIRP